MPTLAEVQAQLTGPGGAFEIVTETVNGVEMKVYKDRMKALRQVAELAAMRGDAQPFLVYGDQRWGFAEFVAQANSVSNKLKEWGVERGDRVAVLSANNPQWCLTFWGTVNIGAILVGLNGWWTADEILYGLEDSGAKILVADKRRLERVGSELGSLKSLERVIVAEDDFDQLVANPTPELPTDQIDEDDPAVIFYTSGTTGRPKGAISTHRSMIANLQNTIFGAMAGAMAGDGGALPQGDTQTASLLTSPLFHVSGCHSGLVVGLLAGIKIVIPEG
ncbi:MAG: AMP-binding protein, partial [Actinomycetota bacterium]